VRVCACTCAYLDVPEPELGAVVGAAGDQVGVVGAPRQVGDPVGVALQRPQQLQLVGVLWRSDKMVNKLVRRYMVTERLKRCFPDGLEARPVNRTEVNIDLFV